MYYPIIPDPIYFYNRQIWFQCLVHIVLPPDTDPDIYIIYIYIPARIRPRICIYSSPLILILKKIVQIWIWFRMRIFLPIDSDLDSISDPDPDTHIFQHLDPGTEHTDPRHWIRTPNARIQCRLCRFKKLHKGN